MNYIRIFQPIHKKYNMQPEETVPQLPADILRLIAQQSPKTYNRLVRTSSNLRKTISTKEVLQAVCFAPVTFREIEDHLGEYLQKIGAFSLFPDDVWGSVDFFWERGTDKFSYQSYFNQINLVKNLPIDPLLREIVNLYWLKGFTILDSRFIYLVLKNRQSCLKYVSNDMIIKYIVEYTREYIDFIIQVILNDPDPLVSGDLSFYFVVLLRDISDGLQPHYDPYGDDRLASVRTANDLKPIIESILNAIPPALNALA